MREIYVEDDVQQASGYFRAVVFIDPDPHSYYGGVDCRTDTDDSTPEAILDDILNRYQGAWSKLADL